MNSPFEKINELPENLDTDRMDLKLVSAEWIDEIFAEIRGNVARHFINFEDRNELQTWINENRRLFARGEKIEMVMLRKESGEFLGMVSIRNLNINPEIGVWVKINAQGQGLAREALETLISWYKIRTGIAEKIKYVVEKGNDASIGLAKKMGMQYIGDVADSDQLVYEEYLI
ncbi:GNAT family N-acetyltransferase [Candidatus Peregrinibacteria bacterium]|nr:GNAT family N-acetyltransferase [Candidatus Peregrinibacteria bacterium]